MFPLLILSVLYIAFIISVFIYKSSPCFVAFISTATLNSITGRLFVFFLSTSLSCVLFVFSAQSIVLVQMEVLLTCT